MIASDLNWNKDTVQYLHYEDFFCITLHSIRTIYDSSLFQECEDKVNLLMISKTAQNEPEQIDSTVDKMKYFRPNQNIRPILI